MQWIFKCVSSIVFVFVFSSFFPVFFFLAAIHNRIGGDAIGLAGGGNVGQQAPAQLQPQQPAQPQAPHQPPPLRLPSVDRDTNNAGTNYPEENKCYKVSVSFDRWVWMCKYFNQIQLFPIIISILNNSILLFTCFFFKCKWSKQRSPYSRYIISARWKCFHLMCIVHISLFTRSRVKLKSKKNMPLFCCNKNANLLIFLH